MISKRFQFFACVFLGSALVLEGSVMEMGSAPKSTRPSDSNFVANPQANGDALLRLARQAGKPCDLIFIGASNIEYWNTTGQTVWERYYANRGALNFGVRGDRTENVLWRFDHMDLTRLHPRAAVIFVGLNNADNTPREIAEGVKAVMKKTQATFPGIRLLVVGLTPGHLSDDTVTEVNRRLEDCADGRTVFYIDLQRRMVKQRTDWQGLGPDHMHMNAEGYAMWAREMEPILGHILPVEPSQVAVK
jgi:beta-glucosidase